MKTAIKYLCSAAIVALAVGAYAAPVDASSAKHAEKSDSGQETKRVTSKSARSAHGDGHWGYEGSSGPQHWGELSSDYHMCSVGQI